MNSYISVLKVHKIGKEVVVRKSTLCWMVTEKKRLSSDRIIRCRRMNCNLEKLPKSLLVTIEEKTYEKTTDQVEKEKSKGESHG